MVELLSRPTKEVILEAATGPHNEVAVTMTPPAPWVDPLRVRLGEECWAVTNGCRGAGSACVLRLVEPARLGYEGIV